jgi:hypothetical protein
VHKKTRPPAEPGVRSGCRAIADPRWHLNTTSVAGRRDVGRRRRRRKGELRRLAGPIGGPAIDLCEELVVFLRGFQDPNREAGRQRVRKDRRRRPHTNYLSTQNNRRAIPWAKTSGDDGTDAGRSGCPHEQSAGRNVTRNTCRRGFVDLEAHGNFSPAPTSRSPLRIAFLWGHGGVAPIRGEIIPGDHDGARFDRAGASGRS